MPRLRSTRRTELRSLSGALAVAATMLLAPTTADAHFTLKAPASWYSQDSSGSPQKMAPCGDEGGGSPSGIVTAYQPGQKITVTIDESVVFHPGHYRIALATTSRSQLPGDPGVTPDAMSACGSTPIMNPPVFPILADGVFVHTAPFTTPQSVQITLPNITCAHCTLQVIEFMSNHGAPCFYHHCADISIGVAPPDGGGGPDASTGGDASSGGDASGADDGSVGGGDSGGQNFGDSGTHYGSPTSDTGGCALSMASDSTIAPFAIAGLFGFATMMRRRRRR